MSPAAAIDLGGTRLRAALVDGARVLARAETTTPRAHGAEAWLEAIADLVRPWAGTARALGLSLTGLIVEGRWSALNPDVLPVPAGLPVEALLVERIGLPTRALNDGHAAAWGEHRYGAGRGVADMLFVTVSTGVGGGLVQGGRLMVGPTGKAGSIGHVVVDPRGPAGGSGRRGNLEAIASGTAVAASAGVPAETVVARALAGDRAMAAILDRSAEALAQALGDVVALCDVGLVVIGGGLGLATGYLARVERQVAGLPTVFRARLARAALGGDAGLIGAADWALAGC
jgi:predicted NBD/HSP70 family sugar kinase